MKPNDVVRVPLRNRRGDVRAEALLSAEDAHLAEERWGFDGRYVSRRVEGRKLYLHREVRGCKPGDGVEVDHRNGDPLDNRRSNLRSTTHAQNGQNVPSQGGSSRHRNVYWYARHGKWMVLLQVRGTRIFGGYHDNEDAAAARAEKLRREHMPYSEVGR